MLGTSSQVDSETAVCKCSLCNQGFALDPDQKPAWWAVTWAEFSHGLLCPPCTLAAKELGSEFSDKEPYGTGSLPWGSDILKKAGTVSEEEWRKHRNSESWTTYVYKHHPEWLNEEEKKIIGSRL